MFRRRRSGGQKYFTRHISGETDTIFDNTSISGNFWPVSVQDSIILSPSELAGVGPAHLIKHIAISGWSWSEDIAAYTVSNTDQKAYAITGACCFYIDQLAENGLPTHDNVPFLNQLGVSATVDLDEFPLRIVHRRRFTLVVNQFNAAPAGGFGGGEFGVGAFPATAASMTAGFGTERHIRRRIRLRPNEAFLARQELYNVVTPGGTASDEKLTLQWDVVGALSFTVVT